LFSMKLGTVAETGRANIATARPRKVAAPSDLRTRESLMHAPKQKKIKLRPRLPSRNVLTQKNVGKTERLVVSVSQGANLRQKRSP
jgi:hypothetical protein